MDRTNPVNKKRVNARVVWLVVILTAALIAAFAWWWNYRKYISTDDANLDNFRVSISARVMAPVLALQVDEGDTVKTGQVLALLGSTHPDDARILAPTDGVVAKRWVLQGDVVQPGQSLFTLNRGTDIWVSVYLEETKFQYIRVGQPALFTLDAYPELTFMGKIFYIGTNAASEFALIPPSNASGNYTKVAQRIPLKISVDGVLGQGKMPRLVSGMSVNVKIKKEK